MTNFTKAAIAVVVILAMLYLVPLMIKLVIGGVVVAAALAYLTGQSGPMIAMAGRVWVKVKDLFGRFTSLFG